MENMQKTFTIKLHTTDVNVDRDTIREFMNIAIDNSEYKDDFTYRVEENIEVLYSFLEDTMAFSYFIRKTKEDFLAEYPYFAEEYDFCLSEFNKNPQEALLTFLENTSTPELTEPYGLTPKDFSFCVGEYIKNNFSNEQMAEFLKRVVQKGLKVVIY